MLVIVSVCAFDCAFSATLKFIPTGLATSMPLLFTYSATGIWSGLFGALSLFAGFTTRGRAFVAAGVAAAVFGLILGQRTLLSIGGLLVILPLLSLLAAGRSNKDIARRLNITEGTAKTHVKAILTKLDAISRTEAVAVAHKRGMIRL